MVIFLLPIFGQSMYFCIIILKWFCLNLWKIWRARITCLECSISKCYELVIKASSSNLKQRKAVTHQQTEKEPSKTLIKIIFLWEEGTENKTSASMADICPLKDGQEGIACIWILPECFVNTHLHSTFSEVSNRISSMSLQC